MMGRVKSQTLGLKSLRTTSGFVLVLVLLPFLVSLAQGMKCYECTNDDSGCFNEQIVGSSGRLEDVKVPDNYIKDCPQASGCVHYEAYIDFTTSFFVRACLYEVDLPCLKLKKVQFGQEVTRGGGWNYLKETVECLKTARASNSLPEPVSHKREVPSESYVVALSMQNELSNNKAPFKERRNDKLKPPPTKNASCFACANGISAYGFDDWNLEYYGAGINAIPYCPGYTTGDPPVINCRGVYGCTAIWEVRNVEKDGVINQVSRIWRGCWFPGEMKCLRNAGAVGRSSPSLKNESCRGKYEQRANSRTLSELIWQQKKDLKKVEDYNAYIQCVKKVSRGNNNDFGNLVDDKNPTGGVPYAKIRFYFCSPGSYGGVCNRGSYPPEEPTTTTLPTTTTKGTGSKGPDEDESGGGDDDLDYKCEEGKDGAEKGKNQGIIMQSTSKVGIILILSLFL